MFVEPCFYLFIAEQRTALKLLGIATFETKIRAL